MSSDQQHFTIAEASRELGKDERDARCIYEHLMSAVNRSRIAVYQSEGRKPRITLKAARQYMSTIRRRGKRNIKPS